ncbi:hypothetical protein ACJX0J_032125, partial [Zea mays]
MYKLTDIPFTLRISFLKLFLYSFSPHIYKHLLHTKLQYIKIKTHNCVYNELWQKP